MHNIYSHIACRRSLAMRCSLQGGSKKLALLHYPAITANSSREYKAMQTAEEHVICTNVTKYSYTISYWYSTRLTIGCYIGCNGSIMLELCKPLLQRGVVNKVIVNVSIM